MKKMITILGVMLVTFTANAKDTDDVRNALLSAKASVEAALKLLDQTSFSESISITKAIEEQCSEHPTGYAPNEQIVSNVKYLTQRTMAKCGEGCTSAVKYEYAPDHLGILGVCTVTVVSSK